MNEKTSLRILNQNGIGYLIFILIATIVAYLMNNLDGFKLIKVNYFEPTIMISILVVFTLIGIPLGYLISRKKLKSINKDTDISQSIEAYKSAYSIRLGFIGGNALLCIVIYYGLNMPIVLIGLPVYFSIILIDRPKKLMLKKDFNG